MRAYVIQPTFGLEHLTAVDRPDPGPVGLGQVLVRVRAVSLNYRDLLVVRGQYNPRMPLPRVPCSDAVGEVVAVGPDVTTVQPGDRVCGTFAQAWEDNPLTEAAARSTLGGDLDGVLAEYVALSEHGVVIVPEHLTDEEAATLPCAAVTAWHAVASGFVATDKTVLLQGTGGVSLFALQFAKKLGARVLITSSRDDKLARAMDLGADAGVNYKTMPDWDKWARGQTGGVGVDLVVEVGGAGTLDRSVKSVRHAGRIALIGVLAGGTGFNPLPLVMRGICLQGILVGPRAMFLAMNLFIERHQLRPVVDKVFPFADATAAFRHLESGNHFGKIVISLAG
ncbi:zinc-dependent alcohol dehydrogenase family protein [Fimbriiglobus ruber]|uniref:Alcohol dehydrogenase n=1 Tax=Fimbriiglobus ruber TaxID=1908690 RepID=A0A225DMD1_9BACT|nr:NAD(P)-dependent alcohol dehydrogenase [Fimbriiglobus ruber]OWK38379.1 alcohol dehydrogenase [Fimbriiglobus ruber]